MARMHEVDYKIIGEDLQFVEIELDPSEAAVAEAGGMMYMEDGIEMEAVFEVSIPDDDFIAARTARALEEMVARLKQGSGS